MLTATQPDLFDYTPPPSAFEVFHSDNPHVYRELVRLARIANSRGKRLGLRCLWENLRYQIQVSTDDEFKLNNDHAPKYARLIMEREPDLAGYFATRERQ